MNKLIRSEPRDSRWAGLYKVGGVSALIIAVLLIGEVFVYSVGPSPVTPMEHIELFRNRPLAGLLHFDLLGMIAYLFFIPLIIALGIVLRRTSASIMLIGSVLFFVGIAVFFSTNTAFSLLSLSKQYTAAATETERMMLLAACQPMITLFNVNAFMVSYIIVSASWIIIGWGMRRLYLFKGFTALAGIVAGTAGIIAEVLENSSPVLRTVAIAVYFAAIVFLFIWVLLSGIRLFKLGLYKQ